MKAIYSNTFNSGLTDRLALNPLHISYMFDECVVSSSLYSDENFERAGETSLKFEVLGLRYTQNIGRFKTTCNRNRYDRKFLIKI